jgi:8-oxo-dGTP pyrophosphatase MutT (NUDIX family)
MVVAETAHVGSVRRGIPACPSAHAPRADGLCASGSWRVTIWPRRMCPVSRRVTSSGVVLLDPEGRVYVRKVAGGFGGYDWSFAKGRLEPGLSSEENALRELREEMGLEARIVGVLGDYEGTTGVTRFYVGEVTGGDPSTHGEETDEVRLLPREEARALLNVARDRRILDDLYPWQPSAPLTRMPASRPVGALALAASRLPGPQVPGKRC